MEQSLGLLFVVFAVTIIIHAIETLHYAVSFVGIRTGRLATAGALFGMVLLLSRTANMVQGVLLGSFADATVRGDLPIETFEWRVRLVVLAATTGSLIGAALLPTFIRYLQKGIEIFVRHGSLVGMAGALIRRGGFSKDDFSRAARGVAPPTAILIKEHSFRMVPWWFYAVDVLVTSIFTCGVLASLYAGVLEPGRQGSAGQMSGVINGIATVLLFFFITPRVATYIDNALRDSSELSQIRSIVIALVFCKICGTLVAQLILHPAAFVIAGLIRLLP